MLPSHCLLADDVQCVQVPDWLVFRKGTAVVDLSEAGDLSSYATLARSDGTSLYITRCVTQTHRYTQVHTDMFVFDV